MHRRMLTWNTLVRTMCRIMTNKTFTPRLHISYENCRTESLQFWHQKRCGRIRQVLCMKHTDSFMGICSSQRVAKEQMHTPLKSQQYVGRPERQTSWSVDPTFCQEVDWKQTTGTEMNMLKFYPKSVQVQKKKATQMSPDRYKSIYWI